VIRRVYSSKRKSGFIVDDKWFLKVYHDLNRKRYFSSIRNLLYGSRPKREFVFSRILREMGINTVEVVNFKNVKFAKFLPLNIGFSKAKGEISKVL